MRLLECNSAGQLSLTKDLIGGDNIPKYAILSHTWGAEEVIFRALIDGTGKSKVGYDKIRFCAQQAANDGLQYFWVDTCYIDKSSSAELQEAINSMFLWYQNAVKCYAYLSDVSTRKQKASDRFSEYTWELAFRESKWFTRGWTLQELLAPGRVEFFSREGKRLGDKRSLEQQIYEVTGIPITALRGTPLSQFDVNDRLLWVENRQTTREEDKAYSLLGIFNVYIPLIYGEGRDNALIRLREAIEKPLKEQKIVFDRLRSADNAAFDSHDEEHNARCYQGTRVELLRQIDTWASDRSSECIFWLNGMAGTGKSTISRTVAQNFADKGDLGASFFFKRGEGDRGHAGLFITTIATQLVRKLPSLAPHVQNAIDADPVITTKALKHQFNTLVLQPLGKIHTDPQQSPRIVVVIDALDECDREEDAKIIILLLSQVKRITSVKLKFFLTSRPELPIRLSFEDISGRYTGLVLHQIPEPVVKEDISTFLEHELAMIRDGYKKSVKSNRQLPADWPGQTNVQILVKMAIPLFIFAATVCRFINDRRCGQPNERLTKVLEYQTKSQASKLDATYLPVLNQLLVGVTNVEKRCIIEEFQQIVGSIAILASPLSATSLDRLFGVPEGTVDSRTDLLHSVLSIPSCPNHPIRLLHLSFRDFLVDTEKRETNPFWVEEKQAHQRIANYCIRLMSSSLKQDICGLEAPGVLVTDVASSRVDHCLPPEVKYACLYWIQHLQKSNAQLYDNDQFHQFLQVHLLHWLETLSWIGKTSEGILAILSLEAQISAHKSPNFYAFLYDAKRFALYNRSVIEQAPLQLYCSAIIFAPEKSVIRRQFENCIPHWIQTKPKVQVDWNAALQILEGYSGLVGSVAFNGKLVVSGSEDYTVRLWDSATGAALQTLEGHSDIVTLAALSPDGKLVISGSDDQTVRLWDATTGVALQTLEGHSGSISLIAFSPDGKLIVSVSGDTIVRVWGTATGALQHTLRGHISRVRAVAFSPDGKQLASASDDKTALLWDVASGAVLQTLGGHSGSVSAVAFSPDGKQVASVSYRKVRLWEATTGAALQTLEGHTGGGVIAIAFSPDSKQLASASWDKTVRLWDAVISAAPQTLEGHTERVDAVVFSPDGKQLASASADEMIRVWDAATGSTLHILKGHTGEVSAIAFSPDSKLLASASEDQTVRLWDVATGAAPQPLDGHTNRISVVVFSPDCRQLASASWDGTIRLWDVAAGAVLYTLAGNMGSIHAVAFSQDGKQVASGSFDTTVRLWDVATGAALLTLKGHTDCVCGVAISPDGKLLASASWDYTVKLWDAETGEVLQTLNGHLSQVCCINSVTFSPNGDQLASASNDRTIRLWDTTTGAVLQTLKGHTGEVTAVAFSPDGNQLVSASWDKTVRLWDILAGSLRSTLQLYAVIQTLSFSGNGLYLETDRGLLHTASLSPNAIPSRSNPPCSILVEEQWVAQGMENFLWLPPDYRATCVAVCGSILVLGHASGRVTLFEFAIANIPRGWRQGLV